MKNQNNYPPLCNTLLTGCSIGVVCLTPKRTEFGKQIRRRYGDNNLPMSRHKMTSLEPRNDGLTNTITTVTKDNYLLETYNQTKTNKFMDEMRNNHGVSYRIRKLTPKECFRLMGVDDKDIDTIQKSGVSNSQQYKMAGNSIVVDVLYHIFRKAFVQKENESPQLTFDF